MSSPGSRASTGGSHWSRHWELEHERLRLSTEERAPGGGGGREGGREMEGGGRGGRREGWEEGGEWRRGDGVGGKER